MGKAASRTHLGPIVIALTFIAKLVLTASVVMLTNSGELNQPDTRVDLGVVYDHPAEAVGQELSFYVQFDGLQEDWNAFGTEFAPSSHLRATVWSDNQRLWDRLDFNNPLGEVYIRTNTRAAQRLLGVQRFQRLLCVGTVRNLRCGKPWIEVTHMYVARQSVSEGSLLHAIRAVDLHSRKAFTLARDEYARAITANLPKAVRSELQGLVDACAKK